MEDQKKEKPAQIEQHSNEKLTVDQAAERIGVSKNTLYSWIYQRTYKIPRYKVGHRLYFKVSDLDDLLESFRIEEQ